MKNIKYVSASVGIVILLSVVVSVPPAHAASLTAAQIQSIVSLLQSFGADSGTIANVQAALSANTTSSVSSTSSSLSKTCLILPNELNGLGTGDSGEVVSALQTFLDIKSTTGYFGPITKAAVESWQEAHDIQGTGYVGTLTIAAMSQGCHNPK